MRHFSQVETQLAASVLRLAHPIAMQTAETQQAASLPQNFPGLRSSRSWPRPQPRGANRTLVTAWQVPRFIAQPGTALVSRQPRAGLFFHYRHSWSRACARIAFIDEHELVAGDHHHHRSRSDIPTSIRIHCVSIRERLCREAITTAVVAGSRVVAGAIKRGCARLRTRAEAVNSIRAVKERSGERRIAKWTRGLRLELAYFAAAGI